MSVHKRAKKSEVRWREGSRNRSRTFDRKGDAETFDRDVRRQKQLGDVVPTRTGSMTLADYFARWIASRHKLAPKTKKLYEYLFETHVFDQLGYVPMSSLTSERLEDWHSERIRSGAGLEAIAKTVKLLRQLFAKEVREGKLPRDPAAGLESPCKPYKALAPPATPRQVEMIREWLLERQRLGDAVLVSLMAYGGLRIGEALALKWEDFSNGDRLWISRSLEDNGSAKPTKTKKEGLVKLPAAAAQDLLMWRREMGAEGLVFPRPKDGNGWTQTDRNNWKRRHFRPAAEAAGWPYPPKNLRHSCASLMIRAGVPPTEVANHLRHSLAVSVNIYQRFMQEMEGQPVRSMDEMIAEAREAVTSGAACEKIEPQENATATPARTSGGTSQRSEL